MSTTDKLAEALRLGQEGAAATEAERLLFEEWMRGHCWALCATWNGKQYVSDAERDGLGVDPRAMNTRQLFAAWRDRAALAAYEAEAKPAEPLFLLHTGQIDSDGEQDEWDCEADSGKRVAEFCRLHPGQTVKLYAAPAAPALVPDPEGTKCLTHEAIAAALTEGRLLNNMQRACLLGLVDADKRKQTCYDAAIQDAERYRWIRCAADDWGICEWDHATSEWVRDTRGAVAINEAIDAAIAASKGGAA